MIRDASYPEVDSGHSGSIVVGRQPEANLRVDVEANVMLTTFAVADLRDRCGTSEDSP